MAARTAVVAGTATAVSGRVARRQAGRYDQPAAPPAAPEQYEAEPQQAPPPPPPPAAPVEAGPPQDEMITKLQQLAQLHSQGVLSDDEFTAAKSKVLGI